MRQLVAFGFSARRGKTDRELGKLGRAPPVRRRRSNRRQHSSTKALQYEDTGNLFFCVFATIGFSLLLFFYTVLLHSGNTRCCCILLKCLCVLFLFYNLHDSTDLMCSRGLKVILAIELKTERVEVTLVKDGSTE